MTVHIFYVLYIYSHLKVDSYILYLHVKLKRSMVYTVRAHLEVHQNTLQYSKGDVLSQSDG